MTPVSLEDHAGDIIQKARSGQGFSLARLAEISHISESELRDIETWEHPASEETLSHLAKTLHLDTHKLSAIAHDRWRPLAPSPNLKNRVLSIEGSIGGYAVNGYILFDAHSRQAAAVDTAFAPEKMLSAVSAHQLTLKYVLLTHAHMDHMGGVEDLKKETGAAVYLHRDELARFQSQSSLKPDGFLDETQTLTLGSLEIGILCTPGHTAGGLSFLVSGTPKMAEALCFTGDALFSGSTGRSISSAGYRQLLNSLAQKVLTLNDQCIVLPGHGPCSTVGEEKHHNPFFDI